MPSGSARSCETIQSMTQGGWHIAARTSAGPSPAPDFPMYTFSRSGPSTEKKARGYNIASVWVRSTFPCLAGRTAGFLQVNDVGLAVKTRGDFK